MLPPSQALLPLLTNSPPLPWKNTVTYFSYHLSGNNVTESQVSTNAVVRLGNATLDLSGTNALCRVSLDAHGLCSACASAAGVPSPPGGMTYRSGEGKSELWSFYVESLVLFYSITPSVKLPDW